MDRRVCFVIFWAALCFRSSNAAAQNWVEWSFCGTLTTECNGGIVLPPGTEFLIRCDVSYNGPSEDDPICPDYFSVCESQTVSGVEGCEVFVGEMGISTSTFPAVYYLWLEFPDAFVYSMPMPAFAEIQFYELTFECIERNPTIAAPQNLTILPHEGTLLLRWEPVEAATSYLIECGFDPDSFEETIATTTDTSFLDSTALSGYAKRFYRVIAVGEARRL